MWRDWADVVMVALIALLALLRYRDSVDIAHLFEKVAKLEGLDKKVTRAEEVRKALYKKLADPKTIENDMERSARAREMRDANRTTLPRESDKPPAKVYRPPLRSQPPGSGWRPNRVNMPVAKETETD